MFNYAGVALMVEHLTCIQKVSGSNPTTSTESKLNFHKYCIKDI